MQILVTYFEKLFQFRLAFAFMNLIILFILVYKCKNEILEILKKIDKRTYMFLLAIIIGQIIFHIFIITPKHVVYLDDFYYMRSAKRIILGLNESYNYERAIGWPFLISIGFLFFGINNYVAIFLCTILGILISLNLFFLTFIISERRSVAIVSSAIFAFLPIKLFWSSTAESHIPSLFFLTLFLWFSLIYYKSLKRRLLWLCLLSLAFATQIRTENFFFFFLFIIGFFILKGTKFKLDFYSLFPWVAAIGLSIVNCVKAIQFYSGVNWLEKESGGLIKGSAISLENFVSNFICYCPKLIDGSLYPLIFSLLILPGVVSLFKEKKKYVFFIIAWFLFLCIIYFSIWLQVYGSSFSIMSKTRLLLFFYPVITIFSSFGIILFFSALKRFKYTKFIILLSFLFIIISFVTFIKSFQFNDPMQELETEIIYSIKRYIPIGKTIITKHPVILNCVNFFNVIDIDKFLKDVNLQNQLFFSSESVLFFEDYTSFHTGTKPRIDYYRLKDMFNLEPFLIFSKDSVKYTFYTLKKR